MDPNYDWCNDDVKLEKVDDDEIGVSEPVKLIKKLWRGTKQTEGNKKLFLWNIVVMISVLAKDGVKQGAVHGRKQLLLQYATNFDNYLQNFNLKASIMSK